MAKNLIGLSFNKLTVIQKASSNRQGCLTWLCICECGNKVTLSSDHLTRKTNPVKSCGCYKKAYKGKNHIQWNGFEEISGNWWYNHVIRERKNKIRQKVPVNITIEFAWNLFLKQNKKCNLSGLDLVISNNNNLNTASVDRIDSSKGYEEDNVQWVHKHVNFMKRTYSNEYFIQICKHIAEFKKS
jgi:hypothetical protein